MRLVCSSNLSVSGKSKTKIIFWIINSKQLKLQSCAKSQIVGNSFALLYLVWFLGSGPNRGRSPVEWGDFPFVRPSIRLSIRLSVPPSRAQEPARQALDPASQALEQARQALGPSRGDGRTYGLMYVRTDVRMYGRRISPILQDFVTYRGRCPKSIILFLRKIARLGYPVSR